MDKTVLITIGIVIFAGAAIWIWQSGFSLPNPAKPVPIPEGIILFYGDGCPHCEVVDEFIEENNIKDKVEFSNLEVWYNKDNQNILAQVVQKCSLNVSEVGVPFLYDGAKCYLGQDDVINFFKNAADIQ